MTSRSLKVVSFNMNGVRSAFRKGFDDWLATHRPDVVCVQELKAQEKDLSGAMRAPAGLSGYFSFAQRPGYSGVGIYCRQIPRRVCRRFGHPVIDEEGRFIRLDFDGYSVVSLYLPSGSSGEARQAVKFEVMRAVYRRLAGYQRARKTEFVVAGDINIAHTKKDIRNWRGNQKNSGFLPEEREWLDRVFGKLRWVDAFRRLNDQEGEYTWWSNRGRARENNVGWRIDYQLATAAMADGAVSCRIDKAARLSDHAPLIIEYRRRGRKR